MPQVQQIEAAVGKDAAFACLLPARHVCGKFVATKYFLARIEKPVTHVTHSSILVGCCWRSPGVAQPALLPHSPGMPPRRNSHPSRSEEHTSELQSRQYI